MDYALAWDNLLLVILLFMQGMVEILLRGLSYLKLIFFLKFDLYSYFSYFCTNHSEFTFI